jgi:hypothetical protein
MVRVLHPLYVGNPGKKFFKNFRTSTERTDFPGAVFGLRKFSEKSFAPHVPISDFWRK